MKKIFAFCFLLFAFAPLAAPAAVQIKKASSVAAAPKDASGGAASLLPTAIGLVSGVMALNASQKAMTAECLPTTSDLAFINNTMKEWARTGQDDKQTIWNKLNAVSSGNCSSTSSNYENSVKTSTKGIKPCYDSFDDSNMVWNEFPKAAIVSVCKDGSSSCDQVSNAYEIFGAIGFGPADYLPGETSSAAKLLEKTEKCSSVKLSAAKKEAFGGFITQTMGTLGQKTNTGSIMDSVGQITSSGGMGGLGSLSGIAGQFLK